MLIDWFTVVAQLINFAILVWLLKHFLYGPVLEAINARDQQIAKVTADAAAIRSEAERDRGLLRERSAQLDEQRAGLLAKAVEEATIERQRLLTAARKAADDITAGRQRALLAEARNLHETIARQAQREVFAIARKTLADLAGASLEARCAEAFTKRLRAMDDQTKAELATALHSATAPALVRSAFELPAEQRSSIQNAINETFSGDMRLRFETAAELISGIELCTEGTKLAWSIAGYLAELERAVSALSKEQTTAAQSESGAGADERAA